jgi:hypothetical protein
MISRDEGDIITLLLSETGHILFYTYCLLQLAMCRSVLLGGCPKVIGLRLSSCYLVYKRVSCGKLLRQHVLNLHAANVIYG